MSGYLCRIKLDREDGQRNQGNWLMSKIILDLCGGTGAWSKPYKDAGYDVRNITLPEYDVSHYVPPDDVHGILAAPPCTEFSLAKNNKPRNFYEGIRIVRSCLFVIWKSRADGYLKFWALENPRGFLRQFLGLPAFNFEQWEFGDFGIKPTDIWGYFNIPKKIIKIKPAGLSKTFPNKRCNAVGWSKSAEKRAITPPGFAQAFFKANP
jgi:hypothetical protein